MLRATTIAVSLTLAFLFLIDWATSSLVHPCLDQVVQSGGNQQPQDSPDKNRCPYEGGVIVEGFAFAMSWHPEAWTALGTVVIAIFTTILGCFTISLAKSTRIAAEAAKESADAAVSLERPYLILGSLHLRDGVIIGGRTTCTCEYTIENYGKTPAVLAWSCVDLRCLQGLPGEPPYLALRSWRDKIVYSHKPIGEGELICILPERDLPFYDQELAGYELFLFGYFIFDDVFGKRRKTGFCYRIDRTMGSFMRLRIPAYHYDIEEND